MRRVVRPQSVRSGANTAMPANNSDRLTYLSPPKCASEGCLHRFF